MYKNPNHALVKDMYNGKVTLSDDISAMPVGTIKIINYDSIKN